MVDRTLIGYEFPSHTVEVERGRLRLFVKAIGDTQPIYRDRDAARAQGHPDLPIPPTYLFCLEMDREDPFDFLPVLQIDLSSILHGEQSFVYHKPIYAGEAITFGTRIADIFDKRNGELEFVVLDTTVHKTTGDLAAAMRRTIVIRRVSRHD